MLKSLGRRLQGLRFRAWGLLQGLGLVGFWLYEGFARAEGLICKG